MAIDAEILQYLPDEYKERLQNFEKMFSSKGWAQLLQFLKASADEKQQRLLFAQNWDQFVFLKGEWNVLQEMVNLEESTYREFEGIAEQAREEAAVAVELEYE